MRKLLIVALGVLDLADSETYQSVKAAVTHIQTLLDKNEAIFDDNASSSAARHWRALRSLVLAEASDGEGRKTRRSKVVAGKFAPPETVRRLSTVFCQKMKIKLQCAECSYIITSKWYWKILEAPEEGHSSCSGPK